MRYQAIEGLRKEAFYSQLRSYFLLIERTSSDRTRGITPVILWQMVLKRIEDFITMNDESFVVTYDVKASKFDQKRFQL